MKKHLNCKNYLILILFLNLSHLVYCQSQVLTLNMTGSGDGNKTKLISADIVDSIFFHLELSFEYEAINPIKVGEENFEYDLNIKKGTILFEYKAKRYSKGQLSVDYNPIVKNISYESLENTGKLLFSGAASKVIYFGNALPYSNDINNTARPVGFDYFARPYFNNLNDSIVAQILLPPPFEFDKFYPITDSVFIELESLPIASFTYKPLFPKINEEITFDASSSQALNSSIESYHWNFGDGHESEGEFVSHEFEMPGEYDVVLTVTNKEGLTDTLLKRIFVSVPVISFYNTYTPPAEDSSERLLVEGIVSASSVVEPVKICADGSNSTLVKLSAFPNDAQPQLRIKDQLSSENPAIYGSLSEEPLDEGTFMFRYNHPSYLNTPKLYHEIYFQILVDNEVLMEYPVQVFRSPVLMLHGLWGKPKTFSKMEEILNSGQWPPDLTLSFDYGPAADLSFGKNDWVVPQAIEDAISQSIDANFSAGKVSIVAHSMGGILTRLYLQSDNYRDEINKLVTLNTPHAGSQMANFLDQNRLLGLVFEYFDKSPFKGAVTDLKVDGPAIKGTLNAITREEKKIPSRVITTTANFNGRDLFGWGKLLSYIIELRYLKTINIVVDAIFNFEPNDLIVAVSSQQGGSSKSRNIPNQWHGGSPNNIDVINEVRALLNNDPNSSVFSKDGFNPKTLDYLFDFEIGNKPSRTSGNDSIWIEKPLNGEEFLPGEIVNISVNGTDNISDILFGAGNSILDIHSEIKEGSNNSFDYQIPTEATGRINILVVGFNHSGFVNMDSIFLKVNVDSPIDTLILSSKEINVRENGITSISTTGHFEDGITRNLTYHEDLSYQTSDSAIAYFSGPGILKGISPGETKVTFSLEDKATSAKVFVLPDFPDTTNLLLPKNGEENVSVQPALIWEKMKRADSYEIEVSPASDFSDLIFSRKDLPDTMQMIGELESGTEYFWRVRAHNRTGKGPWSNPFSFITAGVTSLRVVKSTIPEVYNLFQNFPNPLSSTTTIEFDLPATSYTTLKIYNMHREIETLVNERLLPGKYRITWNAQRFNDGIYFCQLKAGDFVDTKVMILIK